jgi:hypothetical protein
MINVTRQAASSNPENCRKPVKTSFLGSLVVIWRARILALRCGEVVISLIWFAPRRRLDLAPGARFMIAS